MLREGGVLIRLSISIKKVPMEKNYMNCGAQILSHIIILLTEMLVDPSHHAAVASH